MTTEVGSWRSRASCARTSGSCLRTACASANYRSDGGKKQLRLALSACVCISAKEWRGEEMGVRDSQPDSLIPRCQFSIDVAGCCLVWHGGGEDILLCTILPASIAVLSRPQKTKTHLSRRSVLDVDDG